MGHDLLHAKENGFQIDRHQSVPLGFGRILEEFHQHDSGIIEKDVHPPPPGDSSVNDGFYFGLVGHVGHRKVNFAPRFPDESRRFGQCFFLDVDDCDSSVFSGKKDR